MLGKYRDCRANRDRMFKVRAIIRVVTEVDLGLWRTAWHPLLLCGLPTYGPRSTVPRMRAERHV